MITNISKPSSSMANYSRVSTGVTWAEDLNTWNAELNTWDGTFSLIDNTSRVSSSITNTSKPA